VAGTANNIITNNSVSGVRYYSPSIVDANPGDVVGNNTGTSFSGTWTPSDVSGAGLVFTGVNCKYIRTADTVTVWGNFTFPSTANGAGVTISGLPFAPASGMAGAINSMQTNDASAQKIKLAPAQTYFYITNTEDVQQTNAVCSLKYFSFSGTYLI
jgi:hypothetical protein